MKESGVVPNPELVDSIVKIQNDFNQMKDRLVNLCDKNNINLTEIEREPKSLIGIKSVLNKLEKHTHAIAGGTILLSGLGIQFLGL